MDTLKHILDITYELEGLVELTMRRPDTNGTIIPLIADKIAALSHAARELDGTPTSRPVNPEPIPEYSVTEDEGKAGGPDTAVAATELPPVFCPPIQEEPETELHDEELHDEEMHEAEMISDITDGPVSGTPIGRIPFSINDKFLFRRELFGNDNTRYNQALDIIADMTSLEEVRDYLCNDLELDEDSPDVQAFLKRVQVLADI